MCSAIHATACIPDQTRPPDLQTTSWTLETLGSQASTPPRPNHLQHKSSLIPTLVRKIFPGLHRKLLHTVTEPRTSTLLPSDSGTIPQSSHDSTTVVPYLTFPTIVGKNSAFHNLTYEQLEELGGVEFRALNMLMWAVPLVCRAHHFHDSWTFFIPPSSTISSRWRYPLLCWRHTCRTLNG